VTKIIFFIKYLFFIFFIFFYKISILYLDAVSLDKSPIIHLGISIPLKALAKNIKIKKRFIFIMATIEYFFVLQDKKLTSYGLRVLHSHRLEAHLFFF